MKKRTAITAGLLLATLVLCATVFARGASGQIAKVVDDAGRPFFVNAEPPLTAKLHASKPRTNIYLPAESSFSGSNRPAMDIGRDGTEKLVREAADRHRVDPALVRAVIETESNWNPRAYSRKGAGPGRVLLTGLMASPRIERLGTMYRKYRTPISGRVRAGSRMRSSMHMRSTKTLRRTAASYSLTNRQGFQFSVFSFQFSVFRDYLLVVSF